MTTDDDLRVGRNWLIAAAALVFALMAGITAFAVIGEYRAVSAAHEATQAQRAQLAFQADQKCRAVYANAVSVAKDTRDQATSDYLAAGEHHDVAAQWRILAKGPSIKTRIQLEARRYAAALNESQHHPKRFLATWC